MGQPNQVHDRLDALLDGRPGEVTDDLAPLLAAAEELRAELAGLELDPEVADRHLEQALDGPAPVATLPVRKAGGGLRRRVAAVALAAALVLVPATMASASALPGQALYPVKLAAEQVRLAAVQWSPTLEAQVRTGLAATRLQELERLVELQQLTQIPSAIRRVHQAVVAATNAINEAVADGANIAEAASELGEVRRQQAIQLRTIIDQLPPTTEATVIEAIADAVKESPPPAPPVLKPPTVTTTPPNSTDPPVTSSPTTNPPTESTEVATTQPEPPTTASTTTAPTTTAPTTTEAPPGSGDSEAGSPAGAGSEANPGNSESKSNGKSK